MKLPGLRFPKIMPWHCYQDPALIGDGKGDGVPRGTIEPVHAPAPINKPDRYYTQARRLHIRNLMRGAHMKEHRWSEDIVVLLKNWAMWMVASRGGDMSPFPAYNLAPPGKRAGSQIPMLNGDAEDADAVITAMSMRYQQPLRMHYLWPNTSDRANAKRCVCCVNTYKARLDEAHRLFAQGWYARRSRIAQAHAYLHNKVDIEAGKHAA